MDSYLQATFYCIEENSPLPQGKIITEILQHLHACNNSVKVFYGRVDELKCLKEYICGESTMPFVLYGAGGSGKTAMISIAAAKGLQEWLKPAKPLLIVRQVLLTDHVRVRQTFWLVKF